MKGIRKIKKTFSGFIALILMLNLIGPGLMLAAAEGAADAQTVIARTSEMSEEEQSLDAVTVEDEAALPPQDDADTADIAETDADAAIELQEDEIEARTDPALQDESQASEPAEIVIEDEAAPVLMVKRATPTDYTTEALREAAEITFQPPKVLLHDPPGSPKNPYATIPMKGKLNYWHIEGENRTLIAALDSVQGERSTFDVAFPFQPDADGIMRMEIDFASDGDYTEGYRHANYQPMQIRFNVQLDDNGEPVVTVDESSLGLHSYNAADNAILTHLEPKELTLGEPKRLYHAQKDEAQYHIVAFTPSESGRYHFRSLDADEGVYAVGSLLMSGGENPYQPPSGVLYSAPGDTVIDFQKVQLQAGVTYYLMVYFVSNPPSADGSFSIVVEKDPPPEPLNIGSMAEGYTNLTVQKVWNDNLPSHDPVTVRLTQDPSKTLTLSADNGWTGVFEGLPLYDASGEEIRYAVTEDGLGGYTPAYSDVSETARNTYWVMIDAASDLENGRLYVIAAQDWGQAMYFNNPNTYYFLTNPEAEEGVIDMERVENTDTLFTGPKTGQTMPKIKLGDKEHDEWLVLEHSFTQGINAAQVWRLGTEGDGWVLQNMEADKLMTLKGENQWWNWSNPHKYSFIVSDKDGWDGASNTNYAHVLKITPANDGMGYISANQTWGGQNGSYEETRWMYLNLTSYEQVIAAADQQWYAGQFKFFTPIIQAEQSITITNHPIAQPPTPDTPSTPPAGPSTPPQSPVRPDPPATPSAPPAPDTPSEEIGGNDLPLANPDTPSEEISGDDVPLSGVETNVQEEVIDIDAVPKTGLAPVDYSAMQFAAMALAGAYVIGKRKEQ